MSPFYTSFSKLYISGFCDNSSIIFFMSETTVSIYVNRTTCPKIRRICTHVHLTVTWALQIIWINYFTIHILVVRLTFPDFSLITERSEIPGLQNWLLTGVLFPNVIYRLGYDVSMKGSESDLLLTNKLIEHDYQQYRLKSSFLTFYSRYNDFVSKYNLTLGRMLTDWLAFFILTVRPLSMMTELPTMRSVFALHLFCLFTFITLFVIVTLHFFIAL